MIDAFEFFVLIIFACVILVLVRCFQDRRRDRMQQAASVGSGVENGQSMRRRRDQESPLEEGEPDHEGDVSMHGPMDIPLGLRSPELSSDQFSASEVARVLEASRKEYITDHLIEKRVTSADIIDMSKALNKEPQTPKRESSSSVGTESFSVTVPGTEWMKRKSAVVVPSIDTAPTIERRSTAGTEEEEDAAVSDAVSADDEFGESWRESAEAAACTICLGNYLEGETICRSRNRRCNHFFHRKCIEEWLMRHDDCPCCRTNYFVAEQEDSA